MQLVWTILIGFIAGLIAKIVTPGTGPSGFWLTAALGVAGSILASYLGQWMGLYAAGEGSGFIGGVVGAAILLVGYHVVAKLLRPASSPPS
jgi:uncharacterized membrane protein YeaQ/YmgE (transglycosylase-associated protein family)